MMNLTMCLIANLEGTPDILSTCQLDRRPGSKLDSRGKWKNKIALDICPALGIPTHVLI